MKQFIITAAFLCASSLSLFAEEAKAQPPKENKKKVVEKVATKKEKKEVAEKKAPKESTFSRFKQKFNDVDLRTSIKLGTFGAGLDIGGAFAPKHHWRLNINGMKLYDDYVNQDIEFDADFNFLTIGALYDFYPNNANFRLTAGLYYNGNGIDVENSSNGDITIGSTTYTVNEDDLTGEIDFNQIAPYIGVGYGSSILNHRKWSFTADLGLLYQGQADVDLNISGAAAAVAGIQNDLRSEEESIEDDLSSYTFYPVVAFGVTYRY